MWTQKTTCALYGLETAQRVQEITHKEGGTITVTSLRPAVTYSWNAKNINTNLH